MNCSGDNAAREALARVVASRLIALSHDELRVVDVVISRMLGVGRESYGPLVIAEASRDWARETADEMADAIFYVACRAVAANDARLDRLRCEAADEIHGRVEPGLLELRDATPTFPEPLIEFEMADGGES